MFSASFGDLLGYSFDVFHIPRIAISLALDHELIRCIKHRATCSSQLESKDDVFQTSTQSVPLRCH